MIDKKLLSLVLNVEVTELKISGKTIIYNEHFVINIYELMYLCKEWALSKRYKINSRPDSVPTLWEAYINLNITTCHSEVDDTEPKAIIKICEWILKEKICL